MAKNERFLSVDIGATSLKLCEFEFDKDGQMVMKVFAYREYEEELSSDTRMGVVEGVLRQMLLDNNVKARRTLVSLSGQSSLIRFGKINVVKEDRKQIRMLAEFEAKRNIPFAIDSITMDYQLIAGTPQETEDRTLEVMSVVIKREEVEQYTKAIRNVGLSPILIDVAPVACYNSARANFLGEDGCDLLISIGGRSTNLMFVEGERFFARTIPIAGHSITQQIAKEFNMGLPESEELKRHHGYVALGGNYTDPSSETAANVSKLIRNVMSRLHGEISRSINIYRAQQRGSAPRKIYLTGGSSILTYCDTFFTEKFNVPVEYFNPFQVVNIDESVDRTRLSEVAHTFSEVIGLAGRYSRTCPIEINLLPRRIQRQQSFTSKKPYLVGVMASLLALTGMFTKGAATALNEAQQRAEMLHKERTKYEKDYKSITGAISDADSAVGKIDELKKFMAQRAVWPMIMEEIFRAKPDNVWIDSITPLYRPIQPVTAESVVNDPSGGSAGPGDGLGGMGTLDMSGMGMGDLGMGGADSKGSGITKTAIGGFYIVAHTVTIPGSPAMGEDPKLANEPQYPFDTPAVQEEKKDEAVEGENQQPQKPQPLDQSGENLFVRNLRKSKLFSADETITVLTSRKRNALFDNGADFEVQVKLEIPVEAFPWRSAFQNGSVPGVHSGASARAASSNKKKK